jgi:hypothetical protein
MDRLRKAFILMLAADKLGEMAAARDAVLRLAQSEQCGLHELAAALIVGLRRTRSVAERAQQECFSHTEMAQRILDWFECGGHLSEREQEFARDMLEWRNQPSAKQMGWLIKLYRRTGH